MVDTQALRDIMKERGVTQRKLAIYMDITERTLNTKLKTGKFGSEEAQKISAFLHIRNPSKIFFAKEVTSKVTE